jgi:hypothetical protein
MKRGNARGAKEAGHRRWIGSTDVWATDSGRNPILDGRWQPSRGDTSWMNREVHVRICEGLGAKLPGPTRQERRSWPWPPNVGFSPTAGVSPRCGELRVWANTGTGTGSRWQIKLERLLRSSGAQHHPVLRKTTRGMQQKGHAPLRDYSLCEPGGLPDHAWVEQIGQIGCGCRTAQPSVAMPSSLSD